MNEEELKAAVDQFLIDYNTPLHSSWGLREYLFRFADTLLAAQRERDAQIADDYDYKSESYDARVIATAIRNQFQPRA